MDNGDVEVEGSYTLIPIDRLWALYVQSFERKFGIELLLFPIVLVFQKLIILLAYLLTNKVHFDFGNFHEFCCMQIFGISLYALLSILLYLQHTLNPIVCVLEVNMTQNLKKISSINSKLFYLLEYNAAVELQFSLNVVDSFCNLNIVYNIFYKTKMEIYNLDTEFHNCIPL